MGYSATVVLLAVNTAVLLGLAAVAWRHRSAPSVGLFGLLQAVSAVWTGLTAVAVSLPPGPLRLRMWGVTTGLSLVVVVLWLCFIVGYTGRTEWLTDRWVPLSTVPLLAGGAVYFLAPTWPPLSGDVTQLPTAAGTFVDAGIGPVGAVLGVYIYLVFAAGSVLVVRTVVRGERLFTGQAAALVLGTTVTVAASGLTIAGLPRAGYPLTQVALGGQSLLWGYAVFRKQFLRVVPAVARVGERAVFDEIDDGVLVVSSEGRVLRANPQARAYLGDDLAGRPVGTVLDRMGVSALSDLPARYDHGGRTYQAKVSTVSGWRGTTVGQALVVRDVTRLVRRQQRLQVLTRILRHNVRNDMNVVLGVGGRLADADDPALATMGETLQRTADDLTAISEKAIEIDRIFDQSTAVESVDPADLIAGIVTPLAEQYPAATVETTVEPAAVGTDRWLTGLVVEEVVENALEHTGPAPTVEVRVTREGDTVRIAVADDGPGIPTTEAETIGAGRETALQHGSGLGLWLVYWGMQSLGGAVDIATTGTGSTVTLSVPDRESADAAVPKPSPTPARTAVQEDGDD